MKEYVWKSINTHKQSIIELNDAIWDFAELGFKEYKSSKFYIQKLEHADFKIDSGIAGMPTAFKASYGNGSPTIALLAEYDALPGLSQQAGNVNHCPIDDEPAGHGCGHNGISSGVYAAAMVLRDYIKENNRSGTIVVYGCPSEEKGNGKTFMARDGYFDGVDAAFTWHPGDINTVWGMRSLANVSVYFNFKGTTAHAAASPELGRSALDAAELMSVGVNYLREHIIQEARIHYAYIDVGGTAPNIVQDSSKVHYFIRAPKSSQVQEIYKRVIDIAKGAALMTGTTSEYSLYAGLSDFIPSPTLSKVLYESVQQTGVPEFDDEDFKLAHKFFHEANSPEIVEHNKQVLIQRYGEEKGKQKILKPLDVDLAPLNVGQGLMSGSTDVGDVSYVIPTAQIMLAPFALCSTVHNWQVTAQMKTSIAHKAVLAAGAAMALSAIKLIENPDLCAKARQELINETGGKYNCPIPPDICPRLDD